MFFQPEACLHNYTLNTLLIKRTTKLWNYVSKTLQTFYFRITLYLFISFFIFYSYICILNNTKAYFFEQIYKLNKSLVPHLFHANQISFFLEVVIKMYSHFIGYIDRFSTLKTTILDSKEPKKLLFSFIVYYSCHLKQYCCIKY